jgi:hypothetical protein
MRTLLMMYQAIIENSNSEKSATERVPCPKLDPSKTLYNRELLELEKLIRTSAKSLSV